MKPVDPVAARLAAANKASVIMASAVKSSMHLLYPDLFFVSFIKNREISDSDWKDAETNN